MRMNTVKDIVTLFLLVSPAMRVFLLRHLHPNGFQIVTI